MSRADRWTMDDVQAYYARQHPHQEPARASEAAMAEAALLAEVRQLAKAHGWRCYHTHDSRHSEAGFPDVVLCKPGQPVIFAELKDRTRKVTEAQQVWLAFLARATGVEAYVWRPADREAIRARLTRRV